MPGDVPDEDRPGRYDSARRFPNVRTQGQGEWRLCLRRGPRRRRPHALRLASPSARPAHERPTAAPERRRGARRIPDRAALSRRRAAVGGLFGQARADVDHAPISPWKTTVERAASTACWSTTTRCSRPAAGPTWWRSRASRPWIRGDAVHEAAVALTPVHYARSPAAACWLTACWDRPFAPERTLLFDSRGAARLSDRRTSRNAQAGDTRPYAWRSTVAGRPELLERRHPGVAAMR
jgi:hypothetical protein